MKVGISLPHHTELEGRIKAATEDNLPLQEVMLELFELLFEADIGDCD